MSLIVVANAQNVEDQIKEIRKHFSEIETAITKNLYEVKIKEVSDEEEGITGTISSYYEDGNLRKVINDYEIYSENHQVINYYVWGGKLFFVYHISDAPYYGPNMEYELHHTEYRYYFYNEEAIRCLEKYFVINDQTKKSKEELTNTTPNNEKNCNEAKYVLQDFNELK
ncbi:MAG: hypothetical protein C0599_13330 [Salinivirgaceae bacterium]|nr:MAG: hypothetical protein C0599_13330 [Salinivirgaceae bacterium]